MVKDSSVNARYRAVSRHSGLAGPLVSVLVPTYNRRRILPQALASVVRQTYRNLEIFVINDGGEDVSDIVRSFDDPRLVFINRRENRGKPSSLNEALGRVQGKYVAYLDDDDVYYSDHVERLVTALEEQTDCQVAYSDLYKTYCEELPDGRRVVLSKHVEISRDFDRYLMLYFNHVLHVSLMHRRDLLDKTGLYNEHLNILIDWDMTRRLAFFSDFHHVPALTGEFYSPIGECDRISVQRRKDPKEYLRNILAIRTTRPPKPWPKIEDLTIIVLTERLDTAVSDLLLRIWRNTFHPYRLFLPLPASDVVRFKSQMPNVTVIPVQGPCSTANCLDAALQQADGTYVALVPTGLPIDEMWVENPLYALIGSGAWSEGFLLEANGEKPWAGVFRQTDLLKARRARPHLSVEASLASCSVRMRCPTPDELPFQFDEFLRQAKLAEANGDWAKAGRLYESLLDRGHDGLWMKTMAARAYFEAGDCVRAGRLSREVNHERPTVDTLLLEARTCRREQDFHGAVRLLTEAERRLGDPVDLLHEPDARTRFERIEPMVEV
jgi:glycosyltransferase involved in cell wall biosynthesis